MFRVVGRRLGLVCRRCLSGRQQLLIRPTVSRLESQVSYLSLISMVLQTLDYNNDMLEKKVMKIIISDLLWWRETWSILV